MEGSQHTRPLDDDWLAQVRKALTQALNEPGGSFDDIDWLLIRCQDTERMTGQWREASMRQLRKDLQEFNAEFPSLLPPPLLE